MLYLVITQLVSNTQVTNLILRKNMTPNSTIDPKDNNQFESISGEWWNPDGPLKSLHQFTPIRIEYFKRAIRRHYLGSWEKTKPLDGLCILDIGCGGGLLAEPMARLGGVVTAIDSSFSSIEVAKQHAKFSELQINYKMNTVEELVNTGMKFDVIYASEVIEHVSHRALFLNSIRRLLLPKGVIIITTINRTLISLAFAKVAAEYIFNIIPKGTHDFNKFLKPKELQAEALKAGIIIDDITGFKPLLDGRFKTTSVTAINYGASGSLSKTSI